MAGRPQGSQARTESVKIRFTPMGRRILDQMRGPRSVSAYIRSLVEADYNRWKKQGGTQ